jgi:hypothetical protein
MDFWHTDRAVRGFSRALGWSLFKGIPSLFNDTARTIWNPQFEIVCGPDRKQTISTCFSEAKNQKSRPIFSTCPGLFSGINSDSNGIAVVVTFYSGKVSGQKPKSRPA